VPGTPSEVPTSNSVSGISTISKMMKGTERSTFTTTDNTAYKAFVPAMMNGH
jgi:hypothetical protein